VNESSTRPPASSGSRRHRDPRLVALAVAALVVGLDQVTKHWALGALDDRDIDLVWTLRLNLTFNSGASFSVGSGRGGIIAGLGLVALIVAFRSVLTWEGRLAVIGAGVAVGGALGNLVDRAFREGDGFLGGRVVDFIDPQWWPVFNVADICIFTGAGLLVLASFRQPETARSR
jgi:signal peptidase II